MLQKSIQYLDGKLLAGNKKILLEKLITAWKNNKHAKRATEKQNETQETSTTQKSETNQNQGQAKKP